MMEQIDRDVMRTHPDMHFFSGSDQAATQHREVGPPLSSTVASMQPALHPWATL